MHAFGEIIAILFVIATGSVLYVVRWDDGNISYMIPGAMKNAEKKFKDKKYPKSVTLPEPPTQDVLQASIDEMSRTWKTASPSCISRTTGRDGRLSRRRRRRTQPPSPPSPPPQPEPQPQPQPQPQPHPASAAAAS